MTRIGCLLVSTSVLLHEALFKKLVCVTLPFLLLPVWGETTFTNAVLKFGFASSGLRVQPLPSYSKLERLRFYGLPLTVSSSSIAAPDFPKSVQFPSHDQNWKLQLGLTSLSCAELQCLVRHVFWEKLLIYSMDPNSENYSGALFEENFEFVTQVAAS